MEQQSSLRITSWNLTSPFYENESYYVQDVIPHLHWAQGRRERAMQYMQPLNSDVYCLQEANPETAGDIHAALGKETYTLVWSGRTADNDAKPDGCAVLYRRSRLNLVERIVWRYPSGRHIFVACLFVCDEAVKNPLWIVNTHVNFTTREHDLLELQRKLTHSKKFVSGRKVIMGDFNAERTEQWYKALPTNGIVDAMSEQQREQWKYSYNSGKNSKWIDYMLLQKIAADSVIRVFVGNDPSPTAPAPLFNDTGLPNSRVPSDHLPLTLELRV